MDSSKPRSVVFLTEDTFESSVGGVEQHIFHVAQELARSGIQVTVLSLRAGRRSALVERVIKSGDSQFRVEEHVRFNLLFPIVSYLEHYISGKPGMLLALFGKLLPNFHFRTLIRRVQELEPDLVHQHDYVANIVASKIISRTRPVVFTNHTGQYLFLEKFALTRALQRFLIRHYRIIIGPSRELTPADDRAIFISNGVDTDFFSGAKDREFRRDRMVVICPRRWAPTKGIRYLAEAMALLPECDRNRILVLFAGSDSNDYPWYTEEVLRILAPLPDDMYILLGNLDQTRLRDFYLKSDLVVIPSLMEATSLAAMEGMACGLPVLSTNVGGMPDVVVNDGVGWLVEPEDARAIADTLSAILHRQGDLEPMGDQARDFVRSSRSWRHIAGQVRLLYEKIWNGAPLSKEPSGISHVDRGAALPAPDQHL